MHLLETPRLFGSEEYFSKSEQNCFSLVYQSEMIHFLVKSFTNFEFEHTVFSNVCSILSKIQFVFQLLKLHHQVQKKSSNFLHFNKRQERNYHTFSLLRKLTSSSIFFRDRVELHLFDTCHCGKRVRGCVSEYYESSNGPRGKCKHKPAVQLCRCTSKDRRLIFIPLYCQVIISICCILFASVKQSLALPLYE